KLQPTHIITQQLCDVCAITPSDILQVIKNIQPQPEIFSINPTSLEEICSEIMRLGKALNRFEKAKRLVAKLDTKMIQIKQKTEKLNNKKVFCVEWIDPLFASGHWVPEMIEIAGGIDILGFKNKLSRKV